MWDLADNFDNRPKEIRSVGWVPGMNVIQAKIPGIMIIEPNLFGDPRGSLW